MSDFLSFIKQMADFRKPYAPAHIPFASLEEFVLHYGREFSLPEKKIRVRKGRKKECYKNAYNLATIHPEFTYVEGFAAKPSLGLPMQHAWVINEAGEVIDNTWDFEVGTLYFGVAFNTEFLMEQVLRQRFYGLLSDGIMYTDIVKGKLDNFLETRYYKNVPEYRRAEQQ